MNLATEKKEHINSVLDERTLGWLFPALETGQSVCQGFIKSNDAFFDCKEYLNMIPGHLLTYSINRQLKEQMKLASCPFILKNEIINERNKYTIPVIKVSDITISVMRGMQRKKIDSSDKIYLRDRCKKNEELNEQLSFLNFIEKDVSNFHGVLLYAAKKDCSGIEFADIIFLDPKLKKVHHEINLMDKLGIYQSSERDNKDEALFSVDHIIKEFIASGVK